MSRVGGALLAALLPALAVAAPPYDLTALDLAGLMDREVVSSASRFSEPLRDAPSVARVITREDIRHHAWRTLADALDALPGLYISSDRGYSYLGMRGFQRPADYNTLVAVLVDGLPLNDALYSQAHIGGDFLLDLEVVERIEFVPGPGSSVYGSNALLGVVNVITRSGRSLERGQLGLSAGNRDAHREALQLGNADDKQDLLLAASASHDHGETVRMPDAAGSVSDQDGERIRRGLLKYARGAYTFTLAYADRLKYYPTAAYGTVAGSSNAHQTDRQLHAALQHRSELEPGVYLDSRAYFNSYEFIGTYPYARPGGGEYLNEDEGRSQSYGAEWQLTSTRISEHTLVLGAGVKRDVQLVQRNYDLSPRTDYLDDHRDQNHFGVYAQDAWRLGDFLLNSGLRLDHYASFGNTLNPRLALMQQLDPATTLKYLFGTAYRAPNTFEMYYTDGGVLMKANPALEPERLRTLEVALQHRQPA